MKYTTEHELRYVVSMFEEGTIPRDEWGHPEHLIVAYFYCLEHDAEAAYQRMKLGIFKLLEAFGIDKKKEMPYHETMTRFWIRTVSGFVAAEPGLGPVEECAELIERFGKDYPLRFYSRELLFSDEARARFVEPDLQPLNFPQPLLAMQG